MTRGVIRWLSILAATALGAPFVLQGVRDLTAAPPRPRWQPAAAAETAPPLAPVFQPPPDPHAILARNVFDPETGPLWPEPVREEPEPPPPPPVPTLAGTDEPRCETELRIAAAVYDARQPERSRVVLRGPAMGRGRSFVTGMPVGEYVVDRVHPRAVRLRSGSDGGYCWLGMFNERSREKVAVERAKAKREQAKLKRERAKAKRAKARAERKAKRKAKREAKRKAKRK